jgi:RNA polymerase sigma-70 factor (ECF subfamily)
MIEATRKLLFGRKKNLEAFETEALPHLPDLQRAATSLLGDRAHADDVLQEVYLRAWKSFHSYQAGTNCKGWLFRIMFNCIHDHRRRWMNLNMVAAEEETLERKLTYSPPIPDKLTDTEVLRSIEELPINYKAVVILTDVEEMSYKETADILGVPMGTVMSRLSRGRKLLRASLAGVAGEYGIGTAKGGQPR